MGRQTPLTVTASAGAPTTNRHEELQELLRSLRLSGMADTFADLALKAAKANLSHEAFLYELAALETAQRAQRRIERHLRASRLPREKTFATLQLERFSPSIQLQLERLRIGAFVEDAVNVVAVGRPGVGKSHLAAALVLQRHLIAGRSP
jgi:DNA replication protein DnaC